MENYQQEVWNLIDKFETFNLKSIPHTCNASIDMLKHNVRLEDHSYLQGILIKTWKYEVVNEDTKSLLWKRRKILLSPKSLVNIKLNKLLATRIIVSVHARKGRTVRLNIMRCQLNDNIWLYQNNILGDIFP